MERSDIGRAALCAGNRTQNGRLCGRPASTRKVCHVECGGGVPQVRRTHDDPRQSGIVPVTTYPWPEGAFDAKSRRRFAGWHAISENLRP
jgi:hypothetical protein